MQVDVIASYTDFAKLQINWDEIYATDPESHFFLSWKWFSQVFSEYPAGWFILAVKPDTERHDYVAFLPLQLTTRLSGTLKTFCNDIHVAGKLFWADYSGMICHPEFEADAISALSTQLKEHMYWREIYLKNLRISDHRLKLLLQHFKGHSFSIRYLERKSKTDHIDRLISPYVKLPDNFDSYLQESLSANTRQKIRRFLRKVENSQDLKITHSVPETQERDIEILMNFWENKWADRKKDQVKPLADKYRQILRSGFKNDSLFLPVLWYKDQAISALGIFIDRKKNDLLYFVAGRDESCNKLPSGLILHAHSISWAIENSFKSYDFLRGNEAFKYSFGAIERKIRYLLISKRKDLAHHRLLDPLCAHEVLKQSIRYYNSGQLSKAEAGFQAVQEITPDNVTALQYHGRILFRKKQYSKSRNIYQKLLEINKQQAESWHGLGRSLLALNAFLDAETAFRYAIELEWDKVMSSHYYLGRTLHTQNQYASAANEYEAVLNLNPIESLDGKLQENAQHYLEQCRRNLSECQGTSE